MIAMRSSERAAPAFACLTPRDRAFLRVLHDLRFLTSPQAHRACYPGMTLRSVRLRLGELRRRGLLVGLRRDAFTDRRMFWGLTALGRTAAAALERFATEASGPAIEDSPKTSARAALQLEHLAATNELFCEACDAGRAAGLPAARWLAGWRSAVDLGHTRVIPDGVLLVAGPAGWWAYCLERDRGTMPLPAIRDKLERYGLLVKVAGAQGGDPAWEIRADGWLLFACDALSRAEQIARLAAEAGLDRVWAGPADGCIAGLVASLGGIVRSGAEIPAPPPWAAGAIRIPPQTLEEVQR
jgi:hypothetical protein